MVKKITRRGALEVLVGGGAAAIVTSVDPTKALAASCRGVRNSSMGEDLVKLAAEKLYGNTKPEDLKGKLNKDSWNSDDIEAAFSEAWDEMKDCSAAKEIMADKKNGYFAEFTTTAGHTGKSIPKSIIKDISIQGTFALRDIQEGKGIRSNFKYLVDRALQAFLLQVQAGTSSADNFPANAGHVESTWQQGFSQFLENTLQPERDAVLSSKPTQPANKGTGVNFN